MINLCLPASLVESTGTHFAQAWHRQRREPTPTEREWLHGNLARVPVNVTALIGAQMSARELLALEAGDIVGLGLPANKPIDVHVGTTLKFRGRLAVEGRRSAVRIVHRCDAAGVAEAVNG
jgi:flagellar motor switch protein FliM